MTGIAHKSVDELLAEIRAENARREREGKDGSVINEDWRARHEERMARLAAEGDERARRHNREMAEMRRRHEIWKHNWELHERIFAQRRTDSEYAWTKEERKFDRKAKRAESREVRKPGLISEEMERGNLRRWFDGGYWDLYLMRKEADMDHKAKAEVRKRLEMARRMITLANDMLTLPADYAGVSAQLDEAVSQLAAAKSAVAVEREAQGGDNGSAMRRLMGRIGELGYEVTQDFAGNDEFWVVREDIKGESDAEDVAEAGDARAAAVASGAEAAVAAPESGVD